MTLASATATMRNRTRVSNTAEQVEIGGREFTERQLLIGGALAAASVVLLLVTGGDGEDVIEIQQ